MSCSTIDPLLAANLMQVGIERRWVRAVKADALFECSSIVALRQYKWLIRGFRWTTIGWKGNSFP